MLEKPLNLKREKKMGYYSLTEITAVQYAKDYGYFEEKANVICHEIGDGNLNYVFKLDDGEKSIIIKQALPYAKVVGESWPLSIKEQRLKARHYKFCAVCTGLCSSSVQS